MAAGPLAHHLLLLFQYFEYIGRGLSPLGPKAEVGAPKYTHTTLYTMQPLSDFLTLDLSLCVCVAAGCTMHGGGGGGRERKEGIS